MPMEETERLVRRLYELLEAEGRSVDGFKMQAGAVDALTREDFGRLERAGVTDSVGVPWARAHRNRGVELSRSQRLEYIHQLAEDVIGPLQRTPARR